MGQQLMLHTVQEVLDALAKQQLKMTQQQEMMNGVTQIDDEILGTFRDGEELRRLKSALMRGGPTEWDVGNEDFTNKVFDRIRVLYPCLCHLAQFHRLLERASTPFTTDAAQLGGDPAPAAVPAAAVTAVTRVVPAADVNAPLPQVAAQRTADRANVAPGVDSRRSQCTVAHNNGDGFGPLTVLLISCAKIIQDCARSLDCHSGKSWNIF